MHFHMEVSDTITLKGITRWADVYIDIQVIGKVTATNSDEHVCVYWQLKCQQGHYYWQCVQIYKEKFFQFVCLLHSWTIQ